MTTKTLMSTTHIEHGGASSLSDKNNGSAAPAQRPAPSPSPAPAPATRQHVAVENIPPGLKELEQWVVWRLEKTDKGKMTKVPYQAMGTDRKKAASNRPNEWVSFDDAVKFYQASQWVTGLGIMFANGLAGIDIDHCFENGKPLPWAMEIVERMGSYAEITQSGEGLHVLTWGTLPEKARKKDSALGLEMYDQNSPRYFVVTGNVLPGYETITSRHDELNAVHADYLPPRAKPERKPAPANTLPVSLDDATLLDKARAARNGGAFSALYDRGDAAKYASGSEADLALCNKLAFWTAKSGAQMDRLFRNSALYRPKWDKVHRADGATYGQMTIETACNGSGDVYSGQQVRPAGSAGDAPPGDAPQGEPDFLERNADEINALLAELATIAAKRKADKEATKERGDDAPAFDLAVEYACQDPLEKLADIARGLKAGARGRLADKVKETGLIGKTDFLRDVRGDSGALGTGRLQAEPLTTAGYADLYKKWGYRFRLNLLNDELENSGAYFSDPEQDKLIARVRDYGIEHADRLRVSVDHAREAITVTGLARAYHPVKDYLNALQWDGDDHISRLASHFTSADGLFLDWFRHWLCGSVKRVIGGGFQTPMLVLGGLQDLGKSYFAEWICPLPRLFHPGKILTDNKDCSLRQASTFVWEVGEIGHTTRKADIDALKFFITREVVRDRKPYGRRDTVKPALANFIGTFNPDGAGFLVDQTGNRRFLTTNLSKIDWGYTSLDIHQIWAQAVHIVQAGDSWKLTPEQTQDRDEQNKVHLISNPTREALASLYDFTGNPADATTADSVLQTLHTRRGFQVTRVTAVQIGKALKAIEGELAPSGVVITRKRKTTGGVKRTVYHGVKARAPGPPDDDRPMYLD